MADIYQDPDTQEKFLHIHIPKTGGRAIESALLKAGYQLESFPLLAGHVTCADVNRMLRNGYGGKLLRELQLFSSVRNPWDWYVSWYFYILQESKKPNLDPDFTREYAAINDYSNFSDFIKWLMDNRDELVFDNYGLRTKKYQQFVDWLYGSEICVVKLEDFNNINGFTTSGFPNIIISDRVNTTKHEHYSFYYDNKTYELVNEAHRNDIIKWGYRYDDRYTT